MQPITKGEKEYEKLIGPSRTSQWLHWTYRSEAQDQRRSVAKELEKLVLPSKVVARGCWREERDGGRREGE